MIGLARDIAMFRPTLEAFVHGAPAALLLVEFAEEPDENERRLKRLHELMGDLGFDWRHGGAKWGGVVDVLDPKLQAAITELRTAGLNIMMSMKEAGKPISFVEDCAVPLEHLADYTARLTEVFEKNGTSGTWYAHASVGCLHVRPILNLRLDKDVKAMRAIAEQAFSFVREYKGSHSGEHGDGIVRSEFHEFMFGKRLVRAFEEVKDRFDPDGLFNPGKIVRAPKFDDRAQFPLRRRAMRAQEMTDPARLVGLSRRGRRIPGRGRDVQQQRRLPRLAGGVMCPSYRVTREERDVTRGRANSLRLAITGQLGPDALTSDEMAETMKLCVSCKGCRRECPTGVDMARMKIEVQAARAAKHGLSLHDRLVGYLPRYAPYAAKLSWLMNLRDVLPGAAKLSEAIAGFQRTRECAEMGGGRVRTIPEVLAGDGKRARRSRAVRRHLQPLFRAREPRCCARGAERRRLPRACRKAGRRFIAAAVLRPNVSVHREGRRGAQRSRTHARGARAVCRARRSGRRTGAELPAQLPRRGPGDGEGESARRLAEHAFTFEEFLAREAEGGPAEAAARRRSPTARWCTATATRRRSMPSVRSKPC